MVAERVRAFLQQRLEPGARLVVGVSGGPDSVALLHALASVAPGLGLSLHVAHLDHLLRPGSAEDAAFVAALAAEWGLPVTVERVDTAAYRRQARLSLEAAARELRYHFFARAVTATQAAGVAVGHTADDQAETVLLHLLRGTGLAGLAGMAPVQELTVRLAHQQDKALRLRVLRPLLDFQRAELEAYCAQHRLSYRLDASNLDTNLARNRIRHQLLPQLETYNPRIRQALARMASLLREEYAFLEQEAQALWGEVAKEAPAGGAILYDQKAWARLPEALKRQLLREGLRRLRGDLMGIEAAHLEGALKLVATRPAGAVMHLPGGLRLVKEYSRFRLSWAEAELKTALPSQGIPLTVPGVTELIEIGWQVRAEVRDAPCTDWRSGGWHADLDFDAAGGCLAVRPRRPGDRLRPLGLQGEKKVHDLLIDAKVPRGEREAVPIVATPQHIVWVAGHRLDDRFKVTAATRRVLCLRFRRRA